MIARIRKWLAEDLWAEDLRQATLGRELLIGTARILVHAVRSFSANVVGIQAAGLTMISLLALVPICWLGLSVAKALGFDDRLKERLDEFKRTGELPDYMLDLLGRFETMVDGVSFEALSWLGSLILIYTGYSLFTKVEQAFNHVWKAHGMSWYTRLGSFIGLVLVVPVLILTGIVGESILREIEIINLGVRFLPVVGLWVALTMLYKAMPSTRVRWKAALVAGGLAALGIALVHRTYMSAQAGVARYNAVYGALAAIPMLIVYIELLWTVVLAGAEVSYGVHHLHDLRPRREVPPPTHRLYRRLALALAAATCRGGANRAPLELSEFTQQVDVPRKWVDRVAQDLVRAGLITADEKDFVRPNSAEPLTVWDVVKAIEGEDVAERLELPEALEDNLGDARQALRELMQDVRL